MVTTHIPVLKKEALNYLQPEPNKNYIDCTVGEGGHALAIAERILPEGKLLGVDWDEKMVGRLKLKIERSNLKDNVILVCDSFANLEEIVKRHDFKKIDGILFDLGMSSWHIEKSQKGFSFRKDERLDMRYNSENPLTAQEIVNRWPQGEIEKILKEYGGERFSKKIAKEIVNHRRSQFIESTFQLIEILKRAIPRRHHHGKIHFATRTFQALRMATNQELENIEQGIEQAVGLLEEGGRIVVISFHSLEDRIIKNFFKENSKKGLLEVLTKKPITPCSEEIKINPRSRSAKLRAAKKLITNF